MLGNHIEQALNIGISSIIYEIRGGDYEEILLCIHAGRLAADWGCRGCCVLLG
jgi:hypothetical protein